MGLWLKCPKCQTANSLDLTSCMNCNASLENLPAAQRVYLLGKVAPAAPKTADVATAAGDVSQEGGATAESPPKKAKKTRARKKKT
jgi:hypothetical protein